MFGSSIDKKAKREQVLSCRVKIESLKNSGVVRSFWSLLKFQRQQIFKLNTFYFELYKLYSQYTLFLDICSVLMCLFNFLPALGLDEESPTGPPRPAGEGPLQRKLFGK